MASIVLNNIPIKFTCKNSRFQTDISSGYGPKSRGGIKGSVTKKPLYIEGDTSFWLEHIIEIKTNKKLFWFMWYKDGWPLLNMSSVFDTDDLTMVIKNISAIKFD